MKNNDPLKVASDFAASHSWDCNAAFDLAFAVLTECNWHLLARTLKEAREQLENPNGCNENHCLCPGGAENCIIDGGTGEEQS